MSTRDCVGVFLDDRLIDFMYFHNWITRKFFVELCEKVNELDGCMDCRSIRKALGRDLDKGWDEAAVRKLFLEIPWDSNMCIDLTRRCLYEEPYAWGSERAASAARLQMMTMSDLINRGWPLPEPGEAISFDELLKETLINSNA